YYSPQLSRWASPDPLVVHSGGPDPNLYAYVSGSPLKSIDPLGLQGEPSQAEAQRAYDQAHIEAEGTYKEERAAAEAALAHARNPGERAAAEDWLRSLGVNPRPPPRVVSSPQVEAKPGQVAGKMAPERSAASLANAAVRGV